ncbi:MAG: type ISP restriction/modification enzyme [Terriglobia bacterium]
MSTADVDRLRAIKTFPSLVKYLRDELDWPIDSDNFEDLTFDYEPEELGLDAKTAVKIKEIKQLRPLASNQPWGIFFVNFEPKRLPVVVLRRILRSLVIKKRQSANKPQQAAWQLHDLLFISAYGESEHRDITLANFSDDSQAGDLPTLKVLGWDDEDTPRHLAYSHDVLKEKLHWPENPADLDNWRRTWSQAFTLKHREVIGTSKEMAKRMAELATAIRKRVNNVLAVESEKGPMRKLMTAFREALIHDLKEDDFADMYAQTITYGLLSARVSRPAGLVADNIRDMVPITNPFLRDLLSTFLTIGGRKGKIDFDEVGINDVVQALRDANMEAVMRDFDDKNPQEDPVIHFYELFLKEYDPKKRMQRGVFFTPRPVVSFIVRSVDEILRKEFGLADGLADTTTWGEMAKRHPELKIPDGAKPEDPFVQILDPACGTGTFLVEVIDVIHQTMKAKWRSVAAVYDRRPGLDFEFHDRWNEYVSDHLLPRLYGFELMMAPYAIAHMKLGLKLSDTGYSFRSHERARVYLTNSLEPPQDFSDRFEFDAPALAHEAQAVNAVKRHQHFIIVMGNPPYAKHSSNHGEWLNGLLRGKDTLSSRETANYFEVDGAPLGERNPKWLNDDYVKFIRFCHWRIDETGCGILAFITNHGYLDNPTFRGMRRSLMNGFTDIYVLDLHGNSKKKERTPDGSKDENVFDIQQGVTLGVFIKDLSDAVPAKVYHADFWGLRESKNDRLSANAVDSCQWENLQPHTSGYLFIPQDVAMSPEYEGGWLVPKIFVAYASTVTTARNDFSMAYNQATLVGRIDDLKNEKLSDEFLRKKYGLKDVSYWSLAVARKELSQIKNLGGFVKPYCYRPFDFRYVFYHESVCERLRSEVMNHMMHGNVAFLTHRPQSPGDFTFAYCTRMIGDQCVAANKTAGGGNSFQFPLYLYARVDKAERGQAELEVQTAHWAAGPGGRQPNLNPLFIADLEKRLGLKFVPEVPDVAAVHEPPRARRDVPLQFTPEDVFHYIYAIFHSPTYRTRYAEFLKRDFPRLPLTSSLELFRALAKLGGELVALHLMESPKLEKYITKYAGRGGSEVATGYPKFVAAVYDRRQEFAEVYDRRNESVASLNSRNEPAPADRRSQTAATMTGNVHINPTRWFEGVPENVWNFHIGGYQVCEK